MKDANRQNRRNREEGPIGEAQDDSLTELISSYTPKQREAFLKGLRILARVAIRTHMERQASEFRSSSEAPRGEGPK